MYMFGGQHKTVYNGEGKTSAASEDRGGSQKDLQKEI